MFKLNKHLLCFCLCLIFLLAYPSVFAQETLTITTYYPSPYGSYRQLSADQIAIGSTYRNPTYADGTLYVQGNVGIGTTGPNGKLQVRAAADENLIIGGHLTYSSGVLLNAANDAYGANVPMEFRASSFDFTVGNVGIGTTNPTGKLSVIGGGGGSGTNNALVLTSGNINIYTGNNQIVFSYGGVEQQYSHAIITQHDSGTQAGNRMLFNLWNYGTDAVTAIGTKTVMTLNGAGNVGIGTTVPSAKLEVKGSGTTSATYGFIVTDSTAVSNLQVRDDGYGYLRAAAWTYGSDRRMKKNIKYFNGGLGKILQLNPVRFDYIRGQTNQLGFIAQDVQGIIPEAVTVADNQTGYLGLKTDFIIPYLVNAIKEQQKEIESLNRYSQGSNKGT